MLREELSDIPRIGLEDLRSLIKHREFSSLHKAWNPRFDADYSQRRYLPVTNQDLEDAFY